MLYLGNALLRYILIYNLEVSLIFTWHSYKKMWLIVHYAEKTVFFLPAIFFELPITRTFFDFPWKFELSGVDCI